MALTMRWLLNVVCLQRHSRSCLRVESRNIGSVSISHSKQSATHVTDDWSSQQHEHNDTSRTEWGTINILKLRRVGAGAEPIWTRRRTTVVDARCRSCWIQTRDCDRQRLPACASARSMSRRSVSRPEPTNLRSALQSQWPTRPCRAMQRQPSERASGVGSESGPSSLSLVFVVSVLYTCSGSFPITSLLSGTDCPRRETGASTVRQTMWRHRVTPWRHGVTVWRHDVTQNECVRI